ncbi:Translation initiation factor 3 subunit c [Blastocladiella emersonii ATCC 22665]|nr:Translation initiation factor 3 subunit c [Blastocladiella emersonii ATCC 22665]
MASRKNMGRVPAAAAAASDSSSDEETGFFSRSAKVKITKSKWLATRVSVDTSSDDDDESSSDDGMSSSSDDASDDSDADSAASDASDSDEDAGAEPAPAAAKPAHRFLKPAAAPAAADAASSDEDSDSDSEDSPSDSDDSYFGSGSDSDSSDSSDDDRPSDPAARRARWLKDDFVKPEATKRTGPASKPAAADVAARNLAPAAQKRAATVEDATDDGSTTVGAAGAAADKKEKDAAAMLLGDANATNVLEKLTEVSMARGKKSTDRETIIVALERLLAMAPLPFQQIKIILALASCHFDYLTNNSAYLSFTQWKLAASRLAAILEILEANPAISLSEHNDGDDDDAATAAIKEHGAAAAPVSIRGSIVGPLERLDEEFTKSLCAMDVGTPEFAERLRDQVLLYSLLLRTELYVRRIGDKDATSRTLLRRLEHVFNKPDVLTARLHAAVVNQRPALGALSTSVQEICAHLYQNASDRLRTRAVLCHVFHHAIHDRFHAARDMLLMTGLQDSIRTADVATQALFNRSMAHLGLCAFRLGLMREAHGALHDLLSPGNQVARELLNNSTYLLINLELVEAVYLTASMFLEIPYMAANPHDQGRRRVLSKTFRRNFEATERNAFHGPPENTRDHIMAAARALLGGNWESAHALLSAARVWAFFNGGETTAAAVRSMLREKVQETALVTWVHQTAAFSESISMAHLTRVFAVPEPRIAAILGQLVVTGELQGKLDGVNGLLILNARPAAKVQWLTHQLADKLLAISDAHDKILVSRQASENQQHKSSSSNNQNATAEAAADRA